MLTVHRVLAALSLGILLNGAARSAAPGTPRRFGRYAASTARLAPVPTLRRGTPRSRYRRVLSPDELYSRRALQRTRSIIELRLMELQRERLECVREAILRNLPPDLRPQDTEGARSLGRETCARLLR